MRPICMWCTWPRSCHSSLLYFFLFFHLHHHTGSRSSMCITILVLDDGMYKSVFAYRHFPLLLMTVRDKLPHRNIAISNTSSTLLPLLSLGKHMDGPQLSPFPFPEIREAIFDQIGWALRVLSPATSPLAFILIISLL